MSYLFYLTVLFSGTDQYMDQMVHIRRHLHRFPELSNREVKTQAFLKDELLKAGFENIQVMAKTGLRVVYETGRPGGVIAFRADIDALPVEENTNLPFSSQNEGIMHACGHDIHTGIVFGTALAIKNDPDIGGTFVFLFQPAEEGPPPGEEGGAALMIRDGALESPKPEVIFGLHGMGFLPTGTIGYRAGGIMARADRFRIRIEGKQAHGSTPEKGIDPIYTAAELVSAAQSIVSRRTDARDPVVLSFGELHAGQRFNIIPQRADLTGTIRTLSLETGDHIPQLLDSVIAGIAAANGATYVFENETMCPSTQNDARWTEKAVSVLQHAGFETRRVDPVMAAEDFAYYGEHVPGVYFFLGVCNAEPCTNIHSPDYNPEESVMKVGSSFFYELAKSLSKSSESL